MQIEIKPQKPNKESLTTFTRDTLESLARTEFYRRASEYSTAKKSQINQALNEGKRLICEVNLDGKIRGGLILGYSDKERSKYRFQLQVNPELNQSSVIDIDSGQVTQIITEVGLD